MRSSDSTPSRPTDRPVPLYLVRVGDDDPRACTGRRLLERGWVRPLPRSPPAPPILLDPHANVPLSPSDGPPARRGGVLVVDCSWNELAGRGAFPRGIGRRTIPRRLPWLLAGNPQHFGRLAELNTAEAFAASLCLLGELPRAHDLLDGFAGGSAWFELNRSFLTAYGAAGDAEGVRSAERAAFGPTAPAGPSAGERPSRPATRRAVQAGGS